MQQERIAYLTERFFNGEGSEPEMEELASWIKENPDDSEMARVLETAWQNYESSAKVPANVSNRILSNIFPQTTEMPAQEEYPKKSLLLRLWPTIAAAAVLVIGLGIYWFSGKQEATKPEVAAVKSSLTDLPPGGNRAILTLGDGSSIILDSAGTGSLAIQGSTSITKSGNGEIAYQANATAGDAVVFNMVATPKGGQYHIVLPDGSKVWLNAASSLKFPTAFKGTERRVEVTGEVYFEVAHNEQMPFIVKTGETEVRVLGTHFNVMAYTDENILKTTLLEGSVKVSRSGTSAMLVPGQQARISGTSTKIRVINDVDTGREMAWKNGYFQFEDENLESIMRQVSRWYDVEIDYEGNASQEHFTGRLPRNVNVSKMLKILSLSGVKFRIEDKTIIVTP